MQFLQIVVVRRQIRNAECRRVTSMRRKCCHGRMSPHAFQDRGQSLVSRQKAFLRAHKEGEKSLHAGIFCMTLEEICMTLEENGDEMRGRSHRVVGRNAFRDDDESALHEADRTPELRAVRAKVPREPGGVVVRVAAAAEFRRCVEPALQCHFQLRQHPIPAAL